MDQSEIVAPVAGTAELPTSAPESGAPAPAQPDNVTPDQPREPDHLTAAFGRSLSLGSYTVHADDYINTQSDVAPPLHVSTTFRYSSNPDELLPADEIDPDNPPTAHVYSRDTAPNTTRLEAILSTILGGPAVTYASGLAAFHALLVFLNPRRIALSGGYHGCHGVVRLLSKLTGLQALDLADPAQVAQLQAGDVVHVETPVNPTGEARDLASYARLAAEKGCVLTVDTTFGPPPLQDPLALGADVVMHSGTKYLGGHSDLLCGVLAVAPRRAAAGWVAGLHAERVYLGSVMGSLEGWLAVRSVRTLELRVERQSAAATRLAGWLAAELARGGGRGGDSGGADDGSNSSSSSSSSSSVVGKVVAAVHHASLQPEAAVEGSWLRRQMPRGYGPVFALRMRTPDAARRLPSKLALFHHATSLGGVESLIEWRAMTDKTVDKTLLRLSVGIEGWEDLRDDLERGFRALVDEQDGVKTGASGKAAQKGGLVVDDAPVGL